VAISGALPLEVARPANASRL